MASFLIVTQKPQVIGILAPTSARLERDVAQALRDVAPDRIISISYAGFSVSTHTRQAGAFDHPLTVEVARADGQQYLSRLAVQMPPGLLGLLANMPQCPEPQASLGTCTAASQIGATTALVGSGPNSISQQGPVYLTGPYRGAPFGLSIVVPTAAGPFNLGKILVRAEVKRRPQRCSRDSHLRPAATDHRQLPGPRRDRVATPQCERHDRSR